MSIKNKQHNIDSSNSDFKTENKYKHQTWIRQLFTDIEPRKFQLSLIIIAGLIYLI